ncbi:MAG: discoidin domain-containing protein [Planctomycetota bacterium]|jgi:hypothetical protein
MTSHIQVLTVPVLLGFLLVSTSCSDSPGPLARSTSGPVSGPRATARESTREIPVAYDVDVVVVGGSSGGVAAAVAAAGSGAKVFLAAPRPYLGEDICATYRLWLEPDERPISPLAQAIFAEPEAARRKRNIIPLTYEADIESASPHKDVTPPALLNDTKWHSAPSQSVQYDGNVTITTDMGEVQPVRRVHVMAYQRNDDFEVDRITIHTSRDKQRWRQAAVIMNGKRGQGSFEQEAIRLSAWLNETTRYIRFTVKKPAQIRRVLLGEIIVERPPAPAAPAADRVPPTPMQVKRALDDALLEAGVDFLYGCYATDLLEDANGNVAGIVMANRSGRQAVKAKVIIDATARASVARLTEAQFDPYRAGVQTFTRIVVGGPARTGEHLQVSGSAGPHEGTRSAAWRMARGGQDRPGRISPGQYEATLRAGWVR